MFQMMDQAMDPVKAQAMDLEMDLGQVKICILENIKKDAFNKIKAKFTHW